MDNRRNFYRILRVQPDATHDVIQQSYRSLMQKLRLHPDLGGDNHDASIINQAYATLRNPKMRAAYDAELLSRYNIKILSVGSEFSSSVATSDQDDTACHDGNQRNYYRILHVQNDAELEVIKASYRTLLKQLKGEDKQLVDEAFYVVGDTNRRLQYDTLLRIHTHAASAEKLKGAGCLEMKPTDKAVATFPIVEQGNKPNGKQETTLDQPYHSVIKYYCKFCKVPYTSGYFMQKERFCSECMSPLSLPSDVFVKAAHRYLPRMQQSEKATVYEYWPGNPIQILLRDLSPAGLNFSVPQMLDINQIIKVDANHFRAVAQVVYCRSDNSVNSVGVSFLAIEFLRATGNFLSTSA
ncbi:MAG: DnaJ domain-containing protein [Pseudomonadota bacterium]